MLPIGLLYKLGALIDLRAATVLLKTLDATMPMNMLAPGHWALQIALSRDVGVSNRQVIVGSSQILVGVHVSMW